MPRVATFRTTIFLWAVGAFSLSLLVYRSGQFSLSEVLDQPPKYRDVSHIRPKTFFYNRVPKCGSRSLLGVIKELSLRNNFTFSGSDEFKNMRPSFPGMIDEMRKVANMKEPSFYNRHIHFLNFERYGYRKPIYINLIRDPLERFQSNYNYLKYGDFSNSGGQKNGSHPYTDDINGCVKKKLLPCRSRKLFCTGMYLCGFHPICTKPCRKSADLAMKHIQEDYEFIGITEEFENSLRLLEKMFPLHFTGAVEAWSKNQQSKNKTASHRLDELTEESKKILKAGEMAFEIEVYEHAKVKFERLKQKYQLL